MLKEPKIHEDQYHGGTTTDTVRTTSSSVKSGITRNNSSYHSGESLLLLSTFSPQQRQPSSRLSVQQVKGTASLLENDGTGDMLLPSLLPDMETSTRYSGETTVPTTNARFEAELGRGLRNQLSKEVEGELMLSVVAEKLPTRLASFARKLGNEGSPHCRDIMQFVHKHRRFVVDFLP